MTTRTTAFEKSPELLVGRKLTWVRFEIGRMLLGLESEAETLIVALQGWPEVYLGARGVDSDDETYQDQVCANIGQRLTRVEVTDMGVIWRFEHDVCLVSGTVNGAPVGIEVETWDG